jgi:hypothetical protein
MARCQSCGAQVEGRYCSKCGSAVQQDSREAGFKRTSSRSGAAVREASDFDAEVDPHPRRFVDRGVPLYQDLGKKIGRRTWIAVSYAIGCIVLVYILKLWAETGPLFVAAEAATLALAASVLSENEILKFRVPFIWIVTAGFVWSFCRSSEAQQTSANEIMAISLWILFLYTLIRSVSGSVEEFETVEEQSSLGNAWGEVICMWGATLQVALVCIVLIRDPLVLVLTKSWTGWPLMKVLQAIRLTSPFSWLPVGLLVLGLVIYITRLFGSSPIRMNQRAMLTCWVDEMEYSKSFWRFCTCHSGCASSSVVLFDILRVCWLTVFQSSSPYGLVGLR